MFPSSFEDYQCQCLHSIKSKAYDCKFIGLNLITKSTQYNSFNKYLDVDNLTKLYFIGFSCTVCSKSGKAGVSTWLNYLFY